MEIEVTQLDIKNGRRNSCGSCPVALAIQRITGVRPFIETEFVLLDPFTNNPTRRVLPKIARKFVVDYDMGLHVEPFTFRIPVLVC